MGRTDGKWTVFAHRGASGTEPENTLLAFRRALEAGARWVELDVQNVCGRLVVFHDTRLERTTNGRGRLGDRSVEDLRSLDAGKGEKIPFLSEVLEWLDGRAGVNVELKGPGTAALTSQILNGCIKNGGWRAEQFIVSSFLRYELAVFRRLAPDIRIGFLYVGLSVFFPRGFVEKLSPYSVHLSKKSASPALVRNIRAKGMNVFVYTVNDIADADRLAAMGVDGIFTDFPERFSA